MSQTDSRQPSDSGPSPDQPVMVGLTTYQINEQGRYDIPAEYVHGLNRAGANVVLIPPVKDIAIAPILSRLDALVLSGGGDIEPDRYGGTTHETVYNLFPERDQAELAIARWVLQERLPTLAICRGLQIINVACGGSLHVHVPDVYGDEVDHRVPPRNPVDHIHNIVADSCLAGILGEPQVIAQSWHHQSVDKLGEGFRVVATAPDGCVEAIEHPDRPELMAVQWHPELSAATSPPQQNLFNHLVALARAHNTP